METSLHHARQAPSRDFFSRVNFQPKSSRVVLPVFFRQADACLVSRRSFQVMSELNPQLPRSLRPLLNSARLVNSFLAVHRELPAERKRRFVHALTTLHSSPYGRQALTFFGCQRLIAVDGAILRPTLDLLSAYDRIRPGRNSA
jgi:phosphonate transport system substrate-binding protein